MIRLCIAGPRRKHQTSKDKRLPYMALQMNTISGGRHTGPLCPTPAPLYTLPPGDGRWIEMRRPRRQEDTSRDDGAREPRDVLVVEDEAYLCELVADVLEAEGHTTRTASNGQEALARVAERKPQIILLDLMMPVMDGWEFMRALRSNPEWQDIPVVVVTAVYDIKRTQQETGAVAVVTKPFDIDQIADVVTRYSV